jgi:GNAT superfamily N-acetyltransferase
VGGAALASDDVYVGVICDGRHLDPMVASFFTRGLGTRRALIVSDAVASPSEGATLTGGFVLLDGALRNLRAWGFPLADAARMVSRTPAAAVRMSEAGRLDQGDPADVVLWRDGRAAQVWLAGALDASAATDIAAMTVQSCEFDVLTAQDVRRSIFDDPDPQLVLGVYDSGLDAVGAAVVRGAMGFVKFLAVHPRLRRTGVASELLDALESFCAEHGASAISTGNSAPYFVVPGVDVQCTEAVCLFGKRGYERYGEAVNQSVPLGSLPDPALEVRTATDEDHERIRAWLATQHPNWLNETARAHAQGTLIVHEDAGFAAYDVNRHAWFGPMATRGRPHQSPSKGVGTATLLGCLHAMRARGYTRADIAWVGPIAFYARTVGARINRVFWWYRKSLGA